VFTDILTKLIAIRDIITNPAIPDAIDQAGRATADYLHEIAEQIRAIQGSLPPGVQALAGAEFAQCEAVVGDIVGLHAVSLRDTPNGTQAAVSPADILTIIQLVQSAWELLKKIRQRRTGG
jgi:hypothetical protein